MNNHSSKPLWLKVSGWKNSGKTALVTQLIAHLSAEGYLAGSIKHSSHTHPVDVPGKDSFKHRSAGSVKTALVAADKAGLFFDINRERPLSLQFAPHFADCHIVIVEGARDEAADICVETWHPGLEKAPLAVERDDIDYIISTETDDPCLKSADRPVISLRQLLEKLTHALG